MKADQVQGDYLQVYLDTPGDRGGPAVGQRRLQHERWIFHPWGLRHRLMRQCDSGARPRVEQHELNVTYRIRRDCMGEVGSVRAMAFTWGTRMYETTTWTGGDMTGWTPYAGYGHTAAVKDLVRGEY